MMISREKPKNSEKNLLQCHFVQHEVSPEIALG
jgi:hypothetical protein